MEKAEQRSLLQSLGFVRVDGLNANGQVTDKYEIQADPERVGRWDYNNGTFVVVTTDGEVWIGRCPASTSDHNRLTLSCPNGQGAFVPCSNGERIGMHDLLDRLADPDSLPRR